jgi:hypothetical protein
MYYRIRINTGPGSGYINLDKIFTSPESARAEIARERARGALLAPVALVECTRLHWRVEEKILDIF